jgi:hypothetical protein
MVIHWLHAFTFTAREKRDTGTDYIRGEVSPRAGLDAMGKRKYFPMT